MNSQSTLNNLIRTALLNYGVHPDDMGTLLRIAPAALTHICWRNSVLEDWHASPNSRISDAEMMRANVATTRIFHMSLWFALREEWETYGPYSPRIVGVNHLQAAFSIALEEAFDANRLLPHGVTLGKLGGEEYSTLYEDASQQLDSLLRVAEKDGVPAFLRTLAVNGAVAVPARWGMPKWPSVVDEFFRLLDEPDDEHWKIGGHPGKPPAPASDRRWFQELLLSAPDELPTEVLEYCIHDGMLGYVRPLAAATS
ncbi:hypothetical protein [Neomicrococcus lactis]|uniref:hypothetical protein n=1 Tax=Neomicrococcus lactis TaxID=732241 RepID=UPI0023016D89|nr:hypothetical protein [Neomicrococcus lactis]